MADQFAYTPEIIQENREMLSQAHLDSIIDNFPLMELNKGLFTSHSKPKEKQIKKPWTEKEQKLFLEGIEKFGMKSNLYLLNYFIFIIDLKSVSSYIGTRNIGQVRSHLQKYLIKQKKLKEKSKKLKNSKEDEVKDSQESEKGQEAKEEREEKEIKLNEEEEQK